jgi:GNAT superfamily N-acetyltransferase
MTGVDEVDIRRIRADEAQPFKTMRLEALRQAPWAFSATLDAEAALPDSAWRCMVARRAVGDREATFVAESDDRWLGLVGTVSTEGGVRLGGMWVRPEARQTGVGRRLVETAIGWARAQGSPRIGLRVARGNGEAFALYRRCGFVVISDAAGPGEECPDEIAMSITLEGPLRAPFAQS